MREKNSPFKAAKQMVTDAPQLIQQLPQLPQLAIDALQQITKLEKSLAVLSQTPAKAPAPASSKARVVVGLTLVGVAVFLSQDILQPIFEQLPALNILMIGTGLYLLISNKQPS